MSRRTKDCPKCRLESHKGPCVLCCNQRTIPLCPPVGEMVVVCFEDGACYPLLVLKAVRKGEPAMVYVCGHVFVMGKEHYQHMTEVPGPSEAPGHWHWRKDPS